MGLACLRGHTRARKTVIFPLVEPHYLNGRYYGAHCFAFPSNPSLISAWALAFPVVERQSFTAVDMSRIALPFPPRNLSDFPIPASRPNTRTERNRQLDQVADLKYYAIPEVEQKLRKLEKQEREREKTMEVDGEEGGRLLTENVGPDQIFDVVSAWTGIPVNKLSQSERDKLLHLGQVCARGICAGCAFVRTWTSAEPPGLRLLYVHAV